MTSQGLVMTSTADREMRFAQFVERHRNRSIGLAWRLLSADQSAAEDVVQQALMKAWDKLDSFRGDAELSTWFHTILIRQVRSHQRRNAVRRRFAFLLGGYPTVGQATPLGDAGLRERISMALDQLSPGQREAFVLIHLEGYTVTEAAAFLGRSPGTIKSHLHRALRTMRASLGDLKEGEP